MSKGRKVTAFIEKKREADVLYLIHKLPNIEVSEISIYIFPSKEEVNVKNINDILSTFDTFLKGILEDDILVLDEKWVDLILEYDTTKKYSEKYLELVHKRYNTHSYSERLRNFLFFY